jgi:hypothetical protein
MVKIFDDIFEWEGYGGRFNLAAGRCRLRLFDLSPDKAAKVTRLKPIIAVVSDLPGDNPAALKMVSARACISHVATTIVNRFKLAPDRMVMIEYQRRETYGTRAEKVIPAKYEVAELQWHDDKALFPTWRPLKPPLLDTVRALIAENP